MDLVDMLRDLDVKQVENELDELDKSIFDVADIIELLEKAIRLFIKEYSFNNYYLAFNVILL